MDQIPIPLGDYYLNRSGMVDMPEEWKAGILLPRFGLHIANTEQGVFTDYGYLVKSGDEWQRVHEGQPVPEEYRVLSFPAPEILRDAANIPPPVQPETEPKKDIPIILNGKDSAERMKEITDRLETGIQQLFDSDRYKAYLTTMSKFHSYSFNNTLLIAMQGGQLVAGYYMWRDDFHRNVKKGEKSFPVYFWYRYAIPKDKTDGKGMPYEQYARLSDEQKKAYKLLLLLRYYSVFNIDQTDMPEKNPERYARLVDEAEKTPQTDGTTCPEVDHLVDAGKWYCRIEVLDSDSAFYRPSADIIVCPLKTQFPKGADY